jgi:hypothetical protein
MEWLDGEDLARRLAMTFIEWHLGVSGEEARRIVAAADGQHQGEMLSAFWLMMAEACVERARHLRESGEGRQEAPKVERVM